jgi:anti-sigma B factor antagonist
MPHAEISMTVRDAGEGVKVIDVDGDITAFCEAVFTDAYNQAAGPDTKAIVLDFEGLEYMNSGGIGLLVTMLIRAQRNGQRLAAFGLSDHYRQIFSLTRLDEAIGLYDSEEAAVAG